MIIPTPGRSIKLVKVSMARLPGRSGMAGVHGDFVECADVGVDGDEPVVEVCVDPGEAGEFAPSHAGVRGGDHEELVAGSGDAGGDVVDLLAGGDGSFGGASGANAEALAGVVCDSPVGDRFAHQEAEQGHDRRDAGVG
jgi:hypothetical protein